MNNVQIAAHALGVDINSLALTEHRANQLRKEANKLNAQAYKIRCNIDKDMARLNDELFDVMLHTTPKKFLRILAKYYEPL